MSRSPGTRRSTFSADELEASLARRRHILHLRAHEQRNRLSLPALCPAFGTNNLPDCSNMCHESSGAALAETIGIGKACVKLRTSRDGLIFILGQNPGTNHPRMLTRSRRPRRTGPRSSPINPLPEPGLLRFRSRSRTCLTPAHISGPLRTEERALRISGCRSDQRRHGASSGYS